MRVGILFTGVGGSVYMAVNHNGEPVDNVKVGIGNSTPGAALDIRKQNYDGSSGKRASSILLDCENDGTAYPNRRTNGTSNVYQNGLYWAPLYDGYNKISAAVTFAPEGNYFRGGIAFTVNNTQMGHSTLKKLELIL